MATKILIVIASLAVMGLIVGAVVVLRGPGGGGPNASTADSLASKATQDSSKDTTKKTEADVTELQKTDEAVGTGDEAVAGKTVSVHYVGTLTNGTKFDSSRDRNQPFEFVLGSGQVIKGWDQGVAGMKVGGKRKLVIPPDLGYGASGQGSIPANSTLVFEVELLAVK